MRSLIFVAVLLPACLTPPDPPGAFPDGGLDGADGADSDGAFGDAPDGADSPDGAASTSDAGIPYTLPAAFSIVWTVESSSGAACASEDIAADQIILGETFAIFRSVGCPAVEDEEREVTWEGNTAIVDAVTLWSCSEQTYDAPAPQRWTISLDGVSMEMVSATRYTFADSMVCTLSYSAEGALL